MACTILILLWVQDELSYDNFNKNGDNIYRVLYESDNRSEGIIITLFTGSLITIKAAIANPVESLRYE